MRKLAVVVFVAGLLALPAIATAAAGPKCEKFGSERSPQISGSVIEIPGPTAPLRLREAYWRMQCTSRSSTGSSNAASWSGLADERGKVLVPAKYGAVIPLNATTALVNKELNMYDPPVWHYYAYGKGEKGPAPFTHAHLMRFGLERAIPYAYVKRGAVGDYSLWLDGSGVPVQLKTLTSVQGLNGMILAHFPGPKGEKLSRLLDVRGQPISPVIGEVSKWHLITPRTGDFNWLNEPYDLVSLIGDVDHPALPYGKLYVPVTPQGHPMPLPPGAIGVFPVSVHNDRTQIWAVVFATGEGLEIVPVAGRLADAIAQAQAPTTVRYTGMRRRSDLRTSNNAFIEDAMIVRSKQDGLWRPTNPHTLQPLQHDMGPGGFADDDLAYRMYVADRHARQQRIIVAQEARDRQAAEIVRARAAEAWTRIKAAGTLCNNKYAVQQLPAEAVNLYLRTCPMTDPWLLSNRAKDADPAALAEGRRRYDAYAAEQSARRRAEDRARLGLDRTDGGPGDPWAAGLAAYQASAQSGYHAFVADQQAIYQRNLKAWRDGAQNWRPAGQ